MVGHRRIYCKNTYVFFKISIPKDAKEITADVDKGNFKAHKIYITRIWTREEYLCALDKDVFLQNTLREDGHLFTSGVAWNVPYSVMEKLFGYTMHLSPTLKVSCDTASKVCDRYPYVFAYLGKLSYEDYVKFYKKHSEHRIFFQLAHEKTNVAHYNRLLSKKGDDVEAEAEADDVDDNVDESEVEE